MQKAKQAVSDFISHDGKHKTTVDEESRPAVTEEHVRPHQHENLTTAVDKSVHQDHHHTTVQPITAAETLPEQHSHNVMPVEHKTFDHGNSRDLKDTLDRDAAKFQNSSTTHGTTHSAAVAPVAAGERTHHHVHEHVQPVIQKETVAPQVVHTTVPVHETHHASPVHHGTSVLPAESIDTFSGGKGTLHGRDATRVTEFDGCPKPYKNELQTEKLGADKNMHLGKHSSATRGNNVLGSESSSGTRGNNVLGSETSSSGTRGNNVLGSETSSGTRGNNILGSETSSGTRGNKVLSSENEGSYSHSGPGASGFGGSDSASVPRGAAGTAGTTDRQTRSGTSATGTQAKPSLMDKINPTKDADRDGKAGLLD